MNARGVGFALAGLVAVSCFLPDVEFDANAGKGAAGRGGGAGAGAGATGKGGSGGTAGKGGSSSGTGGEGGVDLGTQIEMACSQYCSTYFDACEGTEANTYDDQLDCLITCTTAGWPLGEGEEGGTISCRRVHANLALSTGLADPHCFHSAEVPTKGKCE